MYQSVQIIGNLGRDPEMKFTPSGKAVTSFSIADSRKYTKESGEQVNETTWFRVEVWGKQAEACNQYLKKGSMVFVEGRMKADTETGGPRIYQKKDETYGASFEIIASTVRFLSRSEGAKPSSASVDESEFPF